MRRIRIGIIATIIGILGCQAQNRHLDATVSLYKSVQNNEQIIDSLLGVSIKKRGEIYVMYFESDELSELFHEKPEFSKISLSFKNFDTAGNTEISIYEKEYWKNRYENFLNLDDEMISNLILKKASSILRIHQKLQLGYVESFEGTLRFHLNSKSFISYNRAAENDCGKKCATIKMNWCYCDDIQKEKRLVKFTNQLIKALEE